MIGPSAVQYITTFLIDLFWTAPELLRQCELPQGTTKGDVYSFGIILQEIILQDRPYSCVADNISPKGRTNIINLGSITSKFRVNMINHGSVTSKFKVNIITHVSISPKGNVNTVKPVSMSPIGRVSLLKP